MVEAWTSFSQMHSVKRSWLCHWAAPGGRACNFVSSNATLYLLCDKGSTISVPFSKKQNSTYIQKTPLCVITSKIFLEN